MRLNEVVFDGRVPIDGYGPGFFRIAGAIHHGPLAVLPAGPQPWTGLPAIEVFLDAAPSFDVLFLGTGPEIRPLAGELRSRLEAAGIGVEIMGTASACRTYNVLLSEGRRIAAGLLPV
jgi:uncharacterized protein